MRQPIYRDDDFLIECEVNRYGCIFAHCTVYKYNKEIKKRIKSVWEHLSKFLATKHVYMMTANPKTEKFVKLFGFKFITKHHGKNVYLYEVQ